MKKLLLAGLADLALGGIDFANAADIGIPTYPVRSPVIAPASDFEWFGPYVGAIVGGGWENTKTDYSYSSTTATSPPGFEDIFGPGGPLNVGGGSAVASAIASGFLPTSLGKTAAGFFTAGGLIGFNFQMAQFVFGLEGDFEWMNGFKSTQFVAPPNGFITNTATQTAGVQWLSTLRARVGYAINRVLIFATAGGAFGRVTATTIGSGTDGANTDLFSGGGNLRFRNGFVVGGGIEYALGYSLTIKAEYLFYDLGTVNYAVSPANAIAAGEGLSINASQKFDGNIFRVGLNFKPDWL